MRLTLQTRWKVSGRYLVYFGLPAKPGSFRRRRRISKRCRALLSALDGTQDWDPAQLPRSLWRLVRDGILVEQPKPLPASLEEAEFCRSCCANTYTIPGLELDGQGICPICRRREQLKNIRNILPLQNRIPASPEAEFDVAVFYTGGKDSSYLLWHLACRQKLRVLALTWQVPFLSESASASIRAAQSRLPNVTFWGKPLPDRALSAIYGRARALQNSVCICPYPAYLLFFPELVRRRVPYLVLGNEPAQCKALLFNQMAPAPAFRPWVQALWRLGVNGKRLLTGRKPFRAGQAELDQLMGMLAFGRNGLAARFPNEFLDTVAESFQAAPELLAPFQEAVRLGRRTGALPALVHVDLGDLGEGYHWHSVKSLLEQELGWVAPVGERGLHTSCRIERCKEHAQWTRFRDMKSTLIPFSALELSLAVNEGALSREEAIAELRNSGMGDQCPAEWALMESS